MYNLYELSKSDRERLREDWARKDQALAEAKKEVEADKAAKEAEERERERRQIEKQEALQKQRWDVIKERALNDFLLSGGKEAEFESLWPEIRKKIVLEGFEQGAKRSQKAQYNRLHQIF